MKIEIELTKNSIQAISEVLQRIYTLPVSVDKTEKVYRSIGYELADKFESKSKQVAKKGAQPEKKVYRITLKFHEAWALEAIMISLMDTESCTYTRFKMGVLIDNLNQKLA